MEIIPIVIVAIVLFIVVGQSLKIIKPYQRGVVERLGKYQRTVGSGLTMIMPFVERILKVDMREQVVDVPPQEVITKDNVVVTVDAIVYFEATDPVKLLYNVANFYAAATKLAQTNLRNIIGDMALDGTLTSRETINTRLRQILDDATDRWGVRVVRVEIQRIDPPGDVMEAMHRQMKAERLRRAMVLEADGDREAKIMRANGEKQAAILEAEGRAEAIRQVANADKFRLLTVADGEAEAVIKVYKAIHDGNPTSDLIAIKYLEALEKVANGQATKIFLPMESSSMLGALGGLVEAFRSKMDGAKAGGGPAAN
ncbi:MAG: SPFH/Band 7/PHB domain protein [Candidatus Eisenbacteria bacterium]|uniref:SPFH/Band 7/PHB domain protein n=1 Tax=Eiseniibacteriota bacterium TaxID=2212470 RepID=A0A948RUX5_UNCEI|nr:SPFH/Band 7/PHB domain protein [Candidatus Eisenbacteria bacterium]MBU1950999.1 SPFH/Band 7/PHB domain protein [Candidatus Eisenbacteria bacterium]MBU2690028.1 SPFH/Band 7/PHB domain protein [Candidatus Eisenbacteria bacterium]